MTRMIVVDCTPYGPEPSGARRRAVEILKSWTYFDDLRRLREGDESNAGDPQSVAAAEAAAVDEEVAR